MSPATLVRWAGLACVVAGLFWPLGQLIHPPHTPAGYQSPLWVPAHLLPYLACLLTLFGLVGLLARQLPEAGRLGVVGFVFAFAGTGLRLMEGREQAFTQPMLAARAPELLAGVPGLPQIILTSLVLSVGYVLLGVAIVRAGVVPRPIGAAFMLAPFWAFSPAIVMATGAEGVFLVTATVLGLAYVWLGYSLWTSDGVGQPVDARSAAAGDRPVEAAAPGAA